MEIDRIGKGGATNAHFTPDEVADRAAAAGPTDEQLLRPGFTIYDPCCGSGSLLAAVVRRMLALGIPPHDIATRVFASDIDPEYVEQCRYRISTLLGVEWTGATVGNFIAG